MESEESNINNEDQQPQTEQPVEKAEIDNKDEEVVNKISMAAAMVLL